ncbi:MAG: DUF4389 domain-containing protein [Dehalococcoidia bacterium]|jgi:hypothetical protein
MDGHQATFSVAPQAPTRNRLTVGFRFILAIPHILLVGDVGRTGVLGAVASISAVIDWFIIVFTGKANEDLLELQQFFLRWRARALAYWALLRDEYPPFGDGEYPVEAAFPMVLEDRNRLTVGFRLILIIPQIIVLAVVEIAWLVTAVIGWFATLFTGHYPDGLWEFGEGVLRWELRVETYMLLLHDEYPPFSLK